jgi:hypothetical protein
MRDVARLDDVYAATSSLAVRDRALVQLLTREGWHLRGRLAVLDQPGAVRTTATGADLRAVEEPAAYDVVDAHGRLVRAVRRARPRAVALHLVRTGRGWRLMAVTAVQVRA